ncbi:MAG: FecCD family ABC transporter permease, partial [Egibacteraceae bacterium]
PGTAGGGRWGRPVAVGAAAVAVLVAGLGWDMAIGTTTIGVGAVLAAVFGGAATPEALIVRTVRLPRALLAAVVGSSMSVSGAVMQGITANPIAAPEIMGVTAGAAVVVVGCLTLFTFVTGQALVAAAFAGGAIAGLVVLLLAGAGTGRTSNVRLALAGFTVSALLISLTQGFVIFNDNQTNNVFFWLVGGVNFAKAQDIATVAPWAAAGFVGAMALASSLNVLALGEDMARGVGLRVERVRILGALLIIMLVGSAVAVAGPISFVGLIVPHIVRRLAGTVNHFVVIPLSALVGSALVVYADIGSRYIRYPFEAPAGVVLALIGTPFFVVLARRTKMST